MWELQVKLYLGQNEDCSLGDSISDSSEKLLQRGGGEDSIYVSLVKGEYKQSSTYFFAKGFCWSKGAVFTIKDFSAFLDIRRYKNWAYNIASWK